MSVADRISALTPEQRALFELLRRKQRKPRAHQPPPIPRRSGPDGSGDWPLSFDQERLWFLYQMEPESTAYNIDLGTLMTGRLDVPALRASLAEIVRRHGAWRTTLPTVEGRPVQRVVPWLDVALPLVDLSALPAERRQETARAMQWSEGRRPFALETGPLVRLCLLRLGEREHVCLLAVHHTVTDWITFQLFWRELAALYAAFVAGRPSPLAEPPVHFSDFALWQREWMSGEVLEDYLEFWLGQLQGFPLFLDLPADRPWPAMETLRGGRRQVALGRELTAGLRALARREGSTSFMALMAGTYALLHGLTGQERMILGSPSANRNRPEIEGVLGFFLTQIAYATDLSGDPSFGELVARVRKVALEAYGHQDVPFGKLVEALSPERVIGRPPILQAVVLLLDGQYTTDRLPDLEFQPLDVYDGNSRYDLMWGLYESPESIAGTMEFNAEVFDPATAERLVEGLSRILEAVVADPGLRLSQLPVLSEAARHQALVEWNATGQSLPVGRIDEWIAAQSVERTDAVALVCGEEALSYGELLRRSRRLAGRLRGLGVGPEVRVGVAMERSVELVVAVLGVLEAGGAYVPLDPSYPAERLAFMAADSGLAVLLTEIEKGEEAGESEARPEGGAGPESLAYVIYTSGSTGRPKGVQVPHGALANFLLSMRERPGLGPGDVLLSVTSLSFDIAGLELYLPLLAGARVVLATREQAADGAGLRELLAESQATAMQATPVSWRVLVESGWRGGEGFQALCGGEALSPALAAEVAARAGSLWNLYGPTETTVWSTIDQVRSGAVSIGRPIANTGVHVVDGRGTPVPPGVPGELWIGGAGVARGYLGRPELTAELFVPNPFGAPGSRLYRTGDLARFRADGRLEHLGRRDHQVKVRGFRIELGEIEAALAGHPAVAAAAVATLAEASGERRLAAYVVARPGFHEDLSGELRAWLRKSLPEHMVPTAWMRLESLPLTPNGKVDRRSLPAPGAEPGSPEGESEAPRTPVEELVAGIWCELLGRPRVGRGDDFFALGGHSLLATQVAMRLSDAVGVRIPVRTLFQAPTLAALAREVETVWNGGVPALGVPDAIPRLAVRPVPLPLSFAQQRLWFLDRLMPGDPTYNLPAALKVSGPLSPPAMAAALAGVVARHEALRTTFAETETGPAQVIAPELALSLPQVDLDGLPAPKQTAEMLRLAREEALRPFDLARGPLVRAALLRRGPAEHVLLVTMHHIVSDGWSTGILIAEIAALYRAFASGEPAVLPELPIQYADFAVWQRRWLQGEVLEAQLAYWRAVLADRPAALDLPLDRPRSVRPFRGGVLAVVLPEELVGRLQAVARGEGATLFMVLLAAFQALLGRLADARDVAVGSPIANRNRSEIAGLIGFFVNTLVLRTDLAGDPPFRELAARARRTALGAYAHQDVPFERVVEELNPERNMALSPLFQVLLALQNTPVSAVEIPGLRFEPLALGLASARFDLSLLLAPSGVPGTASGGGLHGELEYDAGLFDRANAERLFSRLRALLDGVTANPGLRLSELPLLDAAERAQLLAEWNRTASAYPREATLPGLFAEQAALRPGAIAVSWKEGELTYGELAFQAGRLARRLAALGAGPEVPVALLAERSLAAIAALLGILGAGGFYVPLDPGFPAERLALLLADSGARILLAERRLLAALPPGVAERVPRVVDLDEALAGDEEAEPPPFGSPPGLFAESLAYAMYTSGSTGRPKGVWATHRNVVRLVRGADYAELGPGEVFLQYAPLSFDASTLEIWGPLLNGGRLVLAPAGRLSLADLGEAVERGGVTSLWLTAGLFHPMVEAGLPGFGSVRQLLAGGDVLSASHVRRALQALPGCRVIDGYGPTEGTTFTCCHGMSSPEEVGETVPIGRPIANSRVYVLDRDLSPLPAGAWGELYAGGDGLARGYLGRPELTAERFVPDPFGSEAGGRLYRTGDVVRWRPDGALEIRGRRDGQVKVRGFRVELGEVEAALLAHPAVREGAVVAREERTGDRRLVAYVAAREGMEVETLAEALLAWLRERLPEPLVPSSVVLLESLPLTANGKVDRAALPADSGPRRSAGHGPPGPPRTPLEELAAGLWAEVLGLEPESVGVHDSFFELGGHSLLATRLVSRAQQLAGVDLPLRVVFESPTLGDFAAALLAHEAKPGQTEKIARAVQRLKGMSAEAKEAKREALRRAEPVI